MKQSPLLGGPESLSRTTSDWEAVKKSPVFGGLESLRRVASETANNVTEFSLPIEVTEGGEVRSFYSHTHSLALASSHSHSDINDC